MLFIVIFEMRRYEKRDEREACMGMTLWKCVFFFRFSQISLIGNWKQNKTKWKTRKKSQKIDLLHLATLNPNDEFYYSNVLCWCTILYMLVHYNFRINWIKQLNFAARIVRSHMLIPLDCIVWMTYNKFHWIFFSFETFLAKCCTFTKIKYK